MRKPRYLRGLLYYVTSTRRDRYESGSNSKFDSTAYCKPLTRHSKIDTPQSPQGCASKHIA